MTDFKGTSLEKRGPINDTQPPPPKICILATFLTIKAQNRRYKGEKQPATSNQRYFKQKRLRIDYFITLTRSCYWLTLFIYGPIYVVESGLPQWVAGGLLSAVVSLMFVSPLIRRAAARFGTRNVIIFALLLNSVSLVAIGLIGEARPNGLIFWLLGALSGVCLDLLANIPFMRTVKPRERTEMTMVFSHLAGDVRAAHSNNHNRGAFLLALSCLLLCPRRHDAGRRIWSSHPAGPDIKANKPGDAFVSACSGLPPRKKLNKKTP